MLGANTGEICNFTGNYYLYLFLNIFNMEPQLINLSNVLIIAVNPRDIYTQLGVFRLGKAIFLKRIRHKDEELSRFHKISDQTEYRTNLIMNALRDNDISFEEVKLVMGRGGPIHPVESGIYHVNEKMKSDLTDSKLGEDVVNLGGLIADALVREMPNAKAYIANPVVVDEFGELARISGHPLFTRKSIFHALNQKYIARKHAHSLGKKYEDMKLIVVNLGRAITVGMHYYGKVIDATQGFDGDGPFSPITSGSLPVGDLIRMCFNGKYTEAEMLKIVRGEGGLNAYLGTPSGYEVDKLIQQGDEKALFYFEAMAYQTSKSIGSMCMTFTGQIDAVLITGAMANSKVLVDFIVERISKVGPVHLYPGDDDLEALAWNGLALLKGEMSPGKYV